jgi:hypothetical protein
MRRALDTLRRKYRDGAREVLAWSRSLVPESSELTETTAMELSARDLMPELTDPEHTVIDTFWTAHEESTGR